MPYDDDYVYRRPRSRRARTWSTARPRTLEDQRYRPPPPRADALSEDAPPYGEPVRLRESFAGLPTGLIGTCVDEELYKRLRKIGLCPIHFRGEVYNVPWKIIAKA